MAPQRAAGARGRAPGAALTLRGARRVGGLAAIAAGAFLLRAAIPWRTVFRQGFTSFPGHDPWYHVRLVENLLGHFPLPAKVDPYLAHPGARPIPVAPGLDLLIAAVAWLLGAGEPSPRLVEAVAALVPPVLGALVIVPVFALARTLAGETAGWLGAALVAVLPGQLLQRSLLGFADHHVAEALLSAAVLALLATALCAVATAEPPGRGASRWQGLAIAAGGCLALYRVSWTQAWMGELLLIASFAVVAVWARPCGGVPAPGTCRAFALTFATAGSLLLVALPIVDGAARDVAMLLAAAALAEATERAAGWARRQPRPARAYAGALMGLSSCAVLTLAIAGGRLAAAVASNLRRLQDADGLAGHVSEARPLAAFDLLPLLWAELGAAWILALAGLALLPWRARSGPLAAAAVLVVWTAGVAAATAGQVRFAYYLAVPVAALAALALARLATLKPVVASVVAALVLALALGQAVGEARRDRGPSDAWVQALRWMRHTTPEPFSDPEAYRALYDPGRPPRSSYGVLAWWDVGYWITRIARRVPIANPTQHGARSAGEFLLAQDEAAAERIAAPLGVGYVIVDRSLPVERPRSGGEGTQGVFPAMAAWAREPADRFFERYEDPLPDGTVREVYLFYPEYYRSMAVRLFTFGGRAVPAARYFVVSWEERRGREGPQKRIVDLTWYPHYRDAANAVLRSPSPHRRLVGVDPIESCVPLEPLLGYQLVYASPERESNHGGVPTVQIYRRGRP
jgi:dolichyl-phosphooligosaccharide-protein glycotransferase